jgi:hypothetical protein
VSIKVDPAALAATVAQFDSAHLLSTKDSAVKVVAVDVTVVDGRLRVPWSKGTAANVAVNPAVTVLFAPTEHHGYSLIVDGTAQDTGDGFLITPASAILHRPAAHADGPLPPGDCGNDCCRI